MNQSDQINELASALSKAQGKINPAIKDSANPFFKSKYADLSSIWEACKYALSENGLAILQTMDYKDSQMILVTTLAHSSGQWIRSSLPINPIKNDAQGIGSAITYMRRYSLAAMVGVTSDEDDDGNAACAPNYKAQKQDKPKNVEPEPKEEPKKLISTQQVDELRKIFSKCPEGYEGLILNSLKIKSMSEIQETYFQRIKTAALTKQDEVLILEKMDSIKKKTQPEMLEVEDV